ncbi:MAG: hypothetical protein ACRYF6_11550 [Janthinobacterium lividum]
MTKAEPNDSDKASSKARQIAGAFVGSASAKEKADEFALSMKPVLEDLAEEGITSRSAIAKALSERGYPTARNGHWTTGRVTDMIGRLAVIKVTA